MADAQVTLKVLFEQAGIKATSQQIDKLTQDLKENVVQSKKLNKEQNKTKRNLEGVAQRSGRAGKDFSRMAQGMGGLVQAYATVAANVFALSSAFLVLRRAADLSSMIKSAENFSQRFGVSVTTITKRMQEASGGALDFAEALPSINKAVSAGVGIEQMEQLTIAATKASQTFGGTTTEALNRFISASQRGRVEIIQTLGVVIKTEQAYEEYAARIGKTAQELTAFDRQQAILNATVQESQKVFDGVNIDPNPFTQFASTLVDLKDKVLTGFTDKVTPIIAAFNKSKEAAAAFIAIITISVAKRIFPEFTSLLSGLTAKSIASTSAATVAAKKALQQRQEFTEEFYKKVGRNSERSLRRQLKREEEYNKKRLNVHKSFQGSILKADGTFDRKKLNLQRAALQKQLNAITERGGKGATDKLSQDPNVLRQQIDLRVRLATVTNSLNVSEQARNATAERTTTIFKKGGKFVKAYANSVKSALIGLKSGVITGFSKSFQTMQVSVLLGIKKMSISWKAFYQSIGVAGVDSLKRFSQAMGRTVGVVAGGLARLVSVATSLFLYWQLAQFAIDKFGDKFKKITKEQRAALDSFENLGTELSDITDRTENYLASTDRAAIGLEGFIKQAEFLRGTFDSIKISVGDFQTALNRLFALHGSDNFIQTFKEMREEIESVEAKLMAMPDAARAGMDIGDPTGSGPITISVDQANYNKLTNQLSDLQTNFEGVTGALRELTKESGPALIGNLASTTRLLNETLSSDISEKLIEDIGTGLSETLGATGDKLAKLIENQEWTTLTAAMLSITDAAQRATAFQIIANYLGVAAEKAYNIQGNFVASGRALEEANRQVRVYLTGIEKATAASVPNKDVFNLLLNAQRAVQDLIRTAPNKENDARIFNLPEFADLAEIREFINLGENATPAQFLAALNKELDVYNAVIEDSVTKQSRAAVIQNKLLALKNEEASSDQRRIQLIREINQAEIDKIALERNSVELALAAAEANLAKLQTQKGADTLAKQRAKATVDSLKAERDGYNLSIKAIEERKNAEREIFKIRAEALATETTINEAKLQVAKTLQGISKTEQKDLEFRKQSFNLEKNALDLQVRKLIEEKNSLKFNEETAQQDQRRSNEIREQLRVLEAQNLVLERRRLLLQAEIAEQSGVSIFDKQGLSLAAQFFVREVRDQARDLKTTFQILGEGFVNVVNSGFDKAVDQLLEDASKFGRRMTEFLKEELRNVFGEALKTQIRAAFAGIFSIEKTTDEKQLAATQTLTFAIERNTEAQLRKTVAAKEPLSVFGTVLPKPEKEAEGITLEKLEDLPSVFTSGISGVQEMLEEGNVLTNLAKEENTKGLFNIFNILGTLISVFGSVGGGFGDFIGGFFGTGGMIPGGTSFTQRAGGGITSGPEFALIGEGSRNEAVVPLPNNREIPVDLKGATGDTINIEQNFDFRGADASAIPRLRQEARAIEERTFNRVFTEINKGGRYAKISGRR